MNEVKMYCHREGGMVIKHTSIHFPCAAKKDSVSTPSSGFVSSVMGFLYFLKVISIKL